MTGEISVINIDLVHFNTASLKKPSHIYLRHGGHGGDVGLEAPEHDLRLQRVAVALGRPAYPRAELRFGEVEAALAGVVEDDVEGRADAEVLLHVVEVLDQVRVVGHAQLLVQAHAQLGCGRDR